MFGSHTSYLYTQILSTQIAKNIMMLVINIATYINMYISRLKGT